ncbi:TIGR02281 family clan AA aspartic protease [Sphingomonas piscis]|uniref:TIGR02281 family clan AA aspartic protease n=1 Tax=Sphingomonas piscis TaxID=2714943 RepID=A0A6G7YLG5_9SPHN|nr:TIGR02281 family clan AA aspartic protease [Sphingomonas piscis]QIK77585.1 TIGR02281 family clan AA aspartic protease [Sphingomonas piscis]
MTNGLQFGSLYILISVLLVSGVLMSRSGRIGRAVVAAFGWLVVFAAGFVLFSFRDDLGMVAQRLKSEATGVPVRQGTTVRVPMAIDGHFWVNASVNGQEVSFLVDSGATMTTIGPLTARRARLQVSPKADQLVRTGAGVIKVSRARADEVEVGSIRRSNVAMHVAAGENVNVLGMNFLSTLSRWSVEGRWLVMTS